MISKECTKCGETKPLNLFTESKTIRSGYTSRCKSCTSKYKRLYREKNKENIALKKKKYYINNKKEITKRNNEYKAKNKKRVAQRLKKYAIENKEKIAEYQKNYKILNKERRAEYEKEKQLSDPLYYLTCKMRKNVLKAFRSRKYKKKSKTEDILGCSFEEFKEHIESQFEDWMNWDNRGLYNGEYNYGWDIDHITPLSTAACEKDIYSLNHYTNLQPLCSKVNRDEKRGKLC